MNLFQPLALGGLTLPNRLVLAPMTRSRASAEGNVPSALAPEYYRQRASGGLLVTEGSQVSEEGVGYIRTPGIHSAAQVEGWRKVTDAVHGAGGRIFLQLWHVGRISHPDFHGGALPVAPSAVRPDGECYTWKGRTAMVEPRALEIGEMPRIVAAFADGARKAKEAGFDGVEIHGSNGYLLDQFVRDGTNLRTDAYGGSIDNRVRLPLEVAEAVAAVFGKDRVGYRIAPYFSQFGATESDPGAVFGHLVDRLSELGLGYLHVTEPISGPGAPAAERRLSPSLRKRFRGVYVANGGYDRDSAEAALARGDADLVAFGVPFLANPDLPERYRTGATLNKPDPSTFFQGEEKGYVDYPALG